MSFREKTGVGHYLKLLMVKQDLVGGLSARQGSGKAKVKVAQSYLTLETPWTILQARILEWVAVPFSRGPHQEWLGVKKKKKRMVGKRSSSLMVQWLRLGAFTTGTQV